MGLLDLENTVTAVFPWRSSRWEFRILLGQGDVGGGGMGWFPHQRGEKKCSIFMKNQT